MLEPQLQKWMLPLVHFMIYVDEFYDHMLIFLVYLLPGT